jgi:hypothetical protein
MERSVPRGTPPVRASDQYELKAALGTLAPIIDVALAARVEEGGMGVRG